MVLFGTLGNNTTPLYGGGQVRNPANVLVLTAAPSANAVGNPVGTIAVNRTTGTAYMAVLNTGLSGSVTWAVLGGSAADVNTINSNAPIAGNYTLAGTANQITVAQTGGTSTWTIPAVFIAPGSIASTTTITSGTGITSTTGNIVASAGNITATLGSISAATSVTAASFVTSSATVGKTLSDTGLIPTGSDANIDMAISGKGTGGVIQSRGVVGGDLTIENTNTDNTNGASRAGVEVAVGGASAGDPYVNFLVSGAGVYTMGIDNSASDNFVLAASAALGTSDIVTVTSAGAVTAAGAITSTAGAITATNGNVVLGTAGNKLVSTSVASTTTAGANSFGTVTLVNGTATVNTTAVTANSIIMLTRQSIGATGANPIGSLSVGTVVAATSFDINSAGTVTASTPVATDVSVVGWMIIN